MKYLTLLFLCITSLSFGQDYWQQEVNYTIDVTLDDKNHTLSGQEHFEYINHSPDALSKIYVHLWPNAYKNSETALAKQQYQDGDSELMFGDEKDKGHIDSLDFKVNGKKAKWYYEEFNIDICIIELETPLKSGEKIMVSTPFSVKIPSGKISRLGHIGQSYQITQWYPKPAVYDKDGWHQMPYLNQGEFYSEFGAFDVQITLPKNYVVGATGDLQTKSELEFLTVKSQKLKASIKEKEGVYHAFWDINPNKTPASDKQMKTIRYTQTNVHDFAWFADKTYNVLKNKVKLPHSNRIVTTWAMFTPSNGSNWIKAPEYLHDAIYYYSKWNGDYPYKNVTAVDGTISAGGGMEYPNVTVIGNTSNAYELEVVIVHEVGHNWFYGQLGTNERVHGWMDEGMNTLNEVRYVQTKYPNNTAMSDMVMGGAFHFNDLDHHDLSDLSYRMLAHLGEDQPVETHSARFSSANYGVVMYQKTGLIFFYLKDYLGEELFDKCMLAYYDEWEFKHPQPEDMKRSMERTSGKDLSWLFGDLIQTTNHLDFKLKKVKKHDGGFDVTVKNIGQINGPIIVQGIDKNDSIIEVHRIEPAKKSTITLSNTSATKIQIDAGRNIPELNRTNNTWTDGKLFKKMEPIQFEFLIGDDENDATNVFWTPTISGNYYDKLMIGAAIHNYGLPFGNFNYIIAPSYSFGRQFISGMSEMNYAFHPKKGLKVSRLGLSVKSFKNDDVYFYNESHYITVAPYWFAKIGSRKNTGPITQSIRVQTIYKKDKFGPTHVEHAGGYVEYAFNYEKEDHRLNIKLRNEYMTNTNSSDEMARILFESTYRFKYMRNKMERWVELRAFIGQQYIRNFNASTSGYRYSMSLGGTDGKQDLFLDEYYFGRNQIDGIWSQQRDENMGGFKTTSNYGTSSIAMATGNLYFSLPIRPDVIGVYVDAGVFHNGVQWNSAINTGIGLRIGKVFGIYFPIWMSKELNDSFGNSKYAEKIRFTLKMNIFNKPFNISNFI